MAERKILIWLILLTLCIAIMPFGSALAADEGMINPEADASLTIAYRCEDLAFPGLQLELYKIASVSADFSFTLEKSFLGHGLEINGVESTAEWNTVRTTLEALIVSKNIGPTATAATNEEGEVSFGDLKPGLYFVTAASGEQDGTKCSFDCALVSLPSYGGDGALEYHVAVAAKPTMISLGDIEYKVIKLWKDENDPGYRPKSIEVEIYKNRKLHETVVLSEKNNWTYTWTAPNDGSRWLTTEKKVDESYILSVERREASFVLTNTLGSNRPDNPPKPPPPTGDSSNIMLYSILMYASGAVLIVLGITGRRKRHEKTG